MKSCGLLLTLATITLVGSFGSPLLAEESAAADLRLAWIDHRLEGKLEAARERYRAVADQEDAPVDVRARALLGLTLLARDTQQPARALALLEEFYALERVAPRWRETARVLRAELEGSTPVEEPGSPPDLLRDLQERVEELKSDLQRVEQTVEEREKELADKDRLLRRLEEWQREALASAEVAERTEALRDSSIERLFSEMEQEDRQSRQLKRYFLRSHLLSARELFEAGRPAEAYNEVKRVLALDPLHREALEIGARCRALLAVSAGRASLTAQEPLQWTGMPRRMVAEMTTAVMRAYLAEAEGHLAAGRTMEALQAASKVLDEYSWCPTPLPEEIVREVVGRADRVLEQCLGGSGAAETAEARKLLETQLELIGRLRKDFSQLMATELALAEADESAQRITGRGPEDGAAQIARELSDSLKAAEGALTAGQPREALRRYREILILLEWVPNLDPRGTIRRRLEEQVEALTGSVEPPVADEAASEKAPLDIPAPAPAPEGT